MILTKPQRPSIRPRPEFAVIFISFLIAAHGIFIIAATLIEQIAVHHGNHLHSNNFDIPLLAGLSLIFLSTLVQRQKQTAWGTALAVYILYFILGLLGTFSPLRTHHWYLIEIIKDIVLPLIIIGLLLINHRQFIVKSDIQGFRVASRFSLIVLIAAFLYGVIGMQLLDTSDFHQEIGWTAAAHYTIDQFDVTTNHPLHPYSKRAKLFLSSLSFISSAAVIYALLSLFQPLRMRLGNQTVNRQHMQDLMTKYNAPSEDFFKLWPHDKQYFFDDSQESGLAYHVKHGVALCVADPAGNAKCFKPLLEQFGAICHRNDWLPALIHVDGQRRKLYENAGFTMQRLGQEAIVDVDHFQTEVTRNKYFRHIRNKFSKQDYSCEMLQPPHHSAVLDRFKAISDDWLGGGNARIERQFVMGYYTTDYAQQCPMMVVRDAAGTIQAFVNQLPTDFDKQEANFDMLRHTHDSPSNINDFLLISFIEYLHNNGYKSLNMGLSPLTGMESSDDRANQLIDTLFRFIYANGDRFFSFSGLHRFKSKYEPEWRDRYVAYQGGIAGFSRTMTALMRAMRISNLRNQ